MKNIEELKNEQQELKAKLHELVEFMNGDEFFSLNESKKKMFNNLKTAVEMHLKCLSILVYEDLDNPFVPIPDFSWLGMAMGLMAPSGLNVPSIKPELNVGDLEKKE